MSSEERNDYDSSVGDKFNSPFAAKMRSLVSDAKTASELKKYLGVSNQAINQYKTGTAYPKTENLIKISEFFHVSLDWLVGLPGSVRIVDADAAAAEKYTGLSDAAIELLHSITGQKEKLSLISAIIENGIFQNNILDDLICLQRVQIELDLDRFSGGSEPLGHHPGGYFVNTFEYYSVLEYRISEKFGLLVDEITHPPIEEV